MKACLWYCQVSCSNLSPPTPSDFVIKASNFRAAKFGGIEAALRDVWEAGKKCSRADDEGSVGAARTKTTYSIA